ncbi:MAG: DnaA/Hda family protein [Pseudomonadota bacterium]
MTERARQLPLDFILPRRRARGRDGFFVSASNKDALALIDGWRDWPDGRLCLLGPEGSGKTHLAHVWMEDAGAEAVGAATLSAEDAPILVAGGAVVVEDVDRIAREAEAALFHLINLAKAEGAHLLLTGRGAPKDWRIETPDLASRLRGTATVSLAPPDDALMVDLLASHMSARHLTVAREVVAYLALRIDRSAAAVAEAAEILDRAALTEKRAITKPFARKALGLP